MNSHRSRFLLAAAALVLSGLTAPSAEAQVPCAQIAPNRAHVCWARPTTDVNGAAVPASEVLTYDVELQQGTAWVNAASAISGTDWTSAVLQPGTYVYRVVSIRQGARSDPSGTGSKAVGVSPTQPVTITIAATGDPGSNRTPAARILDPRGTPRRGEIFALVPIGREVLDRRTVFRYRNQNYCRVAVRHEELWGTTDTSNLAAPCRTSGA